jgi:hypothetical protein
MRTRLILATVCALSSTPAQAHHSIGSVYDVPALVTLAGVVDSLEWQRPHVAIHLTVRDTDGVPHQWRIETLNPQGLKRVGLDQDAIAPGKTITARVHVARDGSLNAVTDAITLPDGRTLPARVGSGSLPVTSN